MNVEDKSYIIVLPILLLLMCIIISWYVSDLVLDDEYRMKAQKVGILVSLLISFLFYLNLSHVI